MKCIFQPKNRAQWTVEGVGGFPNTFATCGTRCNLWHLIQIILCFINNNTGTYRWRIKMINSHMQSFSGSWQIKVIMFPWELKRHKTEHSNMIAYWIEKTYKTAHLKQPRCFFTHKIYVEESLFFCCKSIACRWMSVKHLNDDRDLRIKGLFRMLLIVHLWIRRSVGDVNSLASG